MGGNALKNTKTSRLSLDDFKSAMDKIEMVLGRYGIDFMSPLNVGEKDSFGDIDIIVDIEQAKSLVSVERILRKNPQQEKSAYDGVALMAMKEFGATDFYLNSDFLSLDFRPDDKDGLAFQLDFIFLPKDEMKVCNDYFSYNDLGNLIGVVGSKMGFKFGHDGLKYRVYSESNLEGEVFLSNDYDECLRFFGLNPEVFRNGFYEKREIFEYVVSSNWFKPEYFLTEDGNHRSRAKLKKRKTHAEFLEFLESKFSVKEGANYDVDRLKSEAFEHGKNLFPHLGAEVERVLNESSRAIQVREMFSNKNLSEWTGLAGMELSSFKTKFREQFETKEEYQDFILSKSKDDLGSEVLKFKSELNGGKFKRNMK